TVLAVPGTKISAAALALTACARPAGGPAPATHSASQTRVNALLLSRAVPAGTSGDRAAIQHPALSDDLDRPTHCQPQIAVRAALVDRDFGKPVRILVPEGRTRRAIAEGPRPLQDAPRSGELDAGCQRRCPQAGHGVAEMIDVDDFGEVVGPVSSAIRVVLA